MFQESFDFLPTTFAMHIKLHDCDGGWLLLSFRFRRRFFLLLQYSHIETKTLSKKKLNIEEESRGRRIVSDH